MNKYKIEIEKSHGIKTLIIDKQIRIPFHSVDVERHFDFCKLTFKIASGHGMPTITGVLHNDIAFQVKAFLESQE